MRADAHPPAEVTDRVIGAAFARMALALEGVSCNCAEGRGCVTGAHENRIGGVAIMMDGEVRPGLVRADAVARWCW